MTRSVEDVARDHMDAVRRGDPAAMAADYAADAVLIRGDDEYRSRAAIEAYFASVPERLGAARVVFDELTVEGDQATFRWHLEGGDAVASGRDVCTIAADRIVHQRVHLDAADF